MARERLRKRNRREDKRKKNRERGKERRREQRRVEVDEEQQRTDQQGEEDLALHLEDVQRARRYINRRENADSGEAEFPDTLVDVYAAQMLARRDQPEGDGERMEAGEEGYTFDEDGERSRLQLPTEGIFLNNIPFHHFVLTPLRKRHLRRLRENGIEISHRKFSALEDRQIRANWAGYAAHYGIDESQAPIYMSTQTTEEVRGRGSEHSSRLNFARETNFRPWMCKRLLNRTCGQVFRRCYLLFRDINDVRTAGFLRRWSEEDDAALMELVATLGKAWEKIGTELKRSRYSCHKRYRDVRRKRRREEEEARLNGNGFDNNDGDDEEAMDEDVDWDEVDTARLYTYLCDHMARNPVLVATIPRYAKYEERIDWASDEFHLPDKSPTQRRAMWEELKLRFRAARDSLGTDSISEVERHVFSQPQHLIANTRKVRVRMSVSPQQLAECVQLMLEQTPRVESLRELDKAEFARRLAETRCVEASAQVKDPAKRIIRRIYYSLYVMDYEGLFAPLPLDKDTFEVKLRILSKLLEKADSLKIYKEKVKKCVRRFIRAQGWTQREEVAGQDAILNGDGEGHE